MTRQSPDLIRLLLIFGLLCGLVFGCGESRHTQQNDTAQKSPESFSFFEIGANTRLDKGVRNSLKNRLGRAGVSRRNTIDLERSTSGFLKRYFPAIEALNRQFNSNVGERVEHNATTLTYRYIPPKAPFDMAKLLFSNYTGKPLWFFMHTETEGDKMVALFQKELGTPKVIDRGNDLEKSYFWEKNGDFLIFSVVANQFGQPEYEINLFFVNNLKRFHTDEKEDRQNGDRPDQDSLKNLFS